MKQKEKSTRGSKFLFDGCPICDGIKKADREKRSLTEEELRKLFHKTNEKKGIISF